MNVATTISKTLLLSGALTILLMGGVKIVYAGSNGTGRVLTADNMQQLYLAELNELRANIAKGDQEKVNHGIDTLFEILSVPMAIPTADSVVPETPAGIEEFQGYDSAA